MSGCLSEPSGSPEPDEGPTLSDGDWTPVIPVLPEEWPLIRWPDDNAYSPAKAILGRRLFYERDLSRDGTVTCAWCHFPATAFADKHLTPFSTGVRVQPTHRNSPTLVNVAFGTEFFLDGRAASLEEQAQAPLLSSEEMDMTAELVEERLSADTAYVRLFREVYGDVPITLENVAKALATFERTLISYRTPFDRWQAGEEDAISADAKQGAALYLSHRVGCTQCHMPPLFTDGIYRNIGLDSVTRDVGRAGVTGLELDEGLFKTPTLRNIALTEPYMHDGRFESLEQVLEFYNSGGFPHPNADPRMLPLELTDREIYELVEFLKTLNDEEIIQQKPIWD